MKSLLFISLFFCIHAEAGIFRAPKIIARQIEAKLYSTERAFVLADENQAPYIYKDSDETAYYLKRIRLLVAPFAAFKVPMFEIKVIPKIEFRWTRKNPSGWSNYRKPNS
jgi:hypothetical protein